MKKLQFDFFVDKENYTLTMRREFAAQRQLVWDCYTKAKLLEQWLIPKPYVVTTKEMNFSNGGNWHYSMLSPQGEEQWIIFTYSDINPIDSYKATGEFCDKHKNINTEIPKADWIVTFSDIGQNTLVETVIGYPSLADLEFILSLGMVQGMTVTLEHLDTLILTLQTQ